jgi:hypothetical protein
MVKADERSGTSQKALTMRVSGIGCEWTTARMKGKNGSNNYKKKRFFRSCKGNGSHGGKGNHDDLV